MITCNLKGGLGNQLFQIATTYALANKNNSKCVFNFDKCFTPLQGFPSNKYRNTIFKNFYEDKLFAPLLIYREPKFSFTKIPFVDNMCLDGYFQSELYFEDYKSDLINLFEFGSDKKRFVETYITTLKEKFEKVTAIHIRRGDYVNILDFHTLCPKKYYEKAIESFENSCFVFVSDDMEWVRKEFSQSNFFFFDNTDELLDLCLLSQVDNLIISNSSFSWWGAYLNQKKEKTVIAPKKWFGEKGPKDTENLLPKEWKTI